tara:strand:- start:75 stop:494 length:420 start_codon:yes stop_codon:yes gene_type:complete
LRELNQHPVTALGVNEDHPGTVCARRWCIAGELVTLLSKPRDICVNVIRPKAKVMQTATALLKVGGNWSAAIERVDQFDMSRWHTEESRRRLSGVNNLIAVVLKTEVLQKSGDSTLEVGYGNGNMIQSGNHELSILHSQ